MVGQTRHNWLARFSLVFIAGSSAACGFDNRGITPPPAPTSNVTISGIPAKDSALQQLGILVEVRLDSTLAGGGTCRFVVDGAVQFGSACDGLSLDFASTALHAGGHTAEFAFTPTEADSATVDTTFSFTTIAPKLDPYSATVLQPLAGDLKASASDMNDSGIVVGSSVAADGTSRPVRWLLGQPSELPTSGAAQRTAVSVNASGTIVGIVGPWLADSAMVVWTRNDSLTTVATNQLPLRINDAGQVLTQVWSHATDPHYGYLIYDVTSGTATSFPAQPSWRLVDLNDKGEIVGYAMGRVGGYLDTLVQFGGVSFPSGSVNPYQTLRSQAPIDLNDSGEVLVQSGGAVLFGTAASSVVLNPFFAGGSAERANNHDVVAGIGPDSALYLWRRSANVSERVDPGPGWVFDAVTALTDHGVILAHGDNASTGQSGSVVLTPIGG